MLLRLLPATKTKWTGAHRQLPALHRPFNEQSRSLEQMLDTSCASTTAMLISKGNVRIADVTPKVAKGRYES